MDDEQTPGDKPEGDQKTPAPKAPATVTLTKAEHDALNGTIRTLQKNLKGLEDAEAEREQARLKAEGKHAEAAQRAEDRAKAAEARVVALAKRTALLEAATAAGMTGTQAKAALKLADLDSITAGADGEVDTASATAALDAVKSAFADLFNAAPPPKEGDGKAPNGGKAPSVPPSNPPAQGGKPDGYVSPEEYAATPPDVRRSPAFQKRVELSRGNWPGTVNSQDFGTS